MKRIVVDHREHVTELIGLLRDRYGFEVKVLTLKSGDYFIDPDVLIERKTVRGFVVSIIDGRLFKQAYQLSNYSGRAIIILEGRNFKELDINFNIESIKGALITMVQTFGIPVLRTLNEADTAWYLNRLYEQRSRVGSRLGCLAGYKSKKIKKQKLQLLRTLPGIGRKTSEDLLKYFDSIADIANASEKELQEVPGIGKISAKRIKNVLSDEFTGYNRYE